MRRREGGGLFSSLQERRCTASELVSQQHRSRRADRELTMLTSDTMSMLAMSMLMPTSTGAPAGNHGRVMTASELRRHMSLTPTPAALTSKVGPQTDVVALQQLVHGGLHVGHVTGFVGAEAGEQN